MRVKGREKGGVVTCIYLKTMVYYGWALYGLACFFLPTCIVTTCVVVVGSHDTMHYCCTLT